MRILKWLHASLEMGYPRYPILEFNQGENFVPSSLKISQTCKDFNAFLMNLLINTSTTDSRRSWWNTVQLHTHQSPVRINVLERSVASDHLLWSRGWLLARDWTAFSCPVIHQCSHTATTSIPLRDDTLDYSQSLVFFFEDSQVSAIPILEQQSR